LLIFRFLLLLLIIGCVLIILEFFFSLFGPSPARYFCAGFQAQPYFCSINTLSNHWQQKTVHPNHWLTDSRSITHKNPNSLLFPQFENQTQKKYQKTHEQHHELNNFQELLNHKIIKLIFDFLQQHKLLSFSDLPYKLNLTPNRISTRRVQNRSK